MYIFYLPTWSVFGSPEGLLDRANLAPGPIFFLVCISIGQTRYIIHLPFPYIETSTASMTGNTYTDRSGRANDYFTQADFQHA